MSGRAVDAMTAAEISGLDDGIRDTVVWLRMHGFDTCDSGDGASKFAAGVIDPCAIGTPNVAIQVDPAELAAECDRLQALLLSVGVTLVPFDPFEIAPSIQGSYDPANGTALILLLGFALPVGRGATVPPRTTVHATRDEAIAVSAAELAAEGGGEIVVHDEDCRGSAAGVGCSCAPAVHLITSTGSA